MSRVGTVLVGIAMLVGCSSSPPPPVAAPEAPEQHVHEHKALGPHEGHMLEFGREGYHAEWTHNEETGEVTIYILGEDAKAERPISAAAGEIVVTIGEKTTPYSLTAVDPSGDPPQASRFTTTSRPLLEALKAIGHGVEAELRLSDGDQKLQAAFEHLPHDHHAH